MTPGLLIELKVIMLKKIVIFTGYRVSYFSPCELNEIKGE
ncbi:hypothetical protein L483_01125 [Pseudomonas putida H8234]|nr:hypothetical protein L483_01125 [Pseudomonas putida H8234]